MVEIDRRRRRALASEKRAGSWLHRRAVEQQYRFLRENPRVFLVAGGLYLAWLPLVWLQPGWIRGFLLGASSATVVWLVVLLTWQMSGVGHLQQGELAEQWTVQELRPLTQNEGWHLVNHVLFRPWDIDHVLVGPVGVVVVETKGGNSDWTERRHEPRIRDATRQARENAGDTRRFVRPDIGAAPVYPVVTLWPANEDFVTPSGADPVGHEPQHRDGRSMASRCCPAIDFERGSSHSRGTGSTRMPARPRGRELRRTSNGATQRTSNVTASRLEPSAGSRSISCSTRSVCGRD